MRRYLLALALLGCGDNLTARPDAPPQSDASTALQHCLDSPATIVMPPTGQLPCDLLPPGFGS